MKTEWLCMVCGQQSTLIWQEGAHKARRCTNCGLIAAEFKHTSNFEEEYFEPYYIGTEQSDAERVEYFRQMISLLPERLKAPILDMGAGLGFFIRALPPSLANETTLVEPSSFAREYLLKVCSSPIFASLEEMQTDLPPFATATFWDVLSVVDNPVELLERIRKIMTRDGMLIIKVPNHPERFFRLVSLLKSIKKGHIPLYVPPHRFHFTPGSLQELLNVAGFEVRSWRWVSEPKVIRRKGQYPIKRILLRLGKRLALGRISFVTVARPA